MDATIPSPPGRDAASLPPSRDLRAGGRWSQLQRWKNDTIFVLVSAALTAATWVPASVLRAAGRTLGVVAYLLLGRVRARVRRRLGEGLAKRPTERDVRAAFARAGASLADTVRLLDPDEPADRTLALDAASRSTFREALDEGRGVVFVTAHLGSWERMAALLAAEGFPVATVARESYDPRLTERVYERLRRPRGVRSIYRGQPGATRAVVRELREGRAVGFLIDLPGRSPSTAQPLFGARRPIAVGPARLARALGAAVLVGTPRPSRRAPGALEVSITRVPLPPAWPPALVGAAAPRDGGDTLTAALAAELTRRIRTMPDAWLGLFSP